MIKALQQALRCPPNEHPFLSDTGRELLDALETMRLAGFIVTASDGGLVGKVATARPTANIGENERVNGLI